MTRARDNANLSPTIPDARMPNLTGAITTVEGAVATTIANDAVDSQHYAAGSIDNEHLADDAVGTDELANDVVINTSGAITSTSATGILNTVGGTSARLISYSGNAGAVGTSTNHKFVVQQNATDRITVETSGDVKVHTGNLVMGTAGKGIDFSGYATSGNPSSNLLDDYEEGTWTPNFSNWTQGPTTVGTQRYLKIGKVCHIWFYAMGNALPSYPTLSGGSFWTANTGLPFGCAADTWGSAGTNTHNTLGGIYINPNDNWNWMSNITQYSWSFHCSYYVD